MSETTYQKLGNQVSKVGDTLVEAKNLTYIASKAAVAKLQNPGAPKNKDKILKDKILKDKILKTMEEDLKKELVVPDGETPGDEKEREERIYQLRIDIYNTKRSYTPNKILSTLSSAKSFPNATNELLNPETRAQIENEIRHDILHGREPSETQDYEEIDYEEIDPDDMSLNDISSDDTNFLKDNKNAMGYKLTPDMVNELRKPFELELEPVISETDQLKHEWEQISTSDKKLDMNKIKSYNNFNLLRSLLENPNVKTFNEKTNEYYIEDGEFGPLLKVMQQNGVGLSNASTKRHNDERSDFKSKNSKFHSASLSKTWKKHKFWGGKKTRKGKKGRKGRKTRKGKKGRKTQKGKKGRKTRKGRKGRKGRKTRK
jgi:hypothetical protein